MEPRIRNRFSQQVLAQSAARYGVPTEAVHRLESAESFIYEFEKDDEPFILRIGHSLRRSVELIQGEVEWINYIAIVLFYATVGREHPSEYAHTFLPDFSRGYQRENTFAPDWFAHIPHFLKLRELELYALIHRSNDDVNNLTHWWDIRYMAGRKERIDADQPFLDLDFAALAWS